jgi:hypothetical protein
VITEISGDHKIRGDQQISGDNEIRGDLRISGDKKNQRFLNAFRTLSDHSYNKQIDANDTVNFQLFMFSLNANKIHVLNKL